MNLLTKIKNFFSTDTDTNTTTYPLQKTKEQWEVYLKEIEEMNEDHGLLPR